MDVPESSLLAVQYLPFRLLLFPVNPEEQRSTSVRPGRWGFCFDSSINTESMTAPQCVSSQSYDSDYGIRALKCQLHASIYPLYTVHWLLCFQFRAPLSFTEMRFFLIAMLRCYGDGSHLLDLGLRLHEDELPLPGEGSLQPGQVLLFNRNTRFTPTRTSTSNFEGLSGIVPPTWSQKALTKVKLLKITPTNDTP